MFTARSRKGCGVSRGGLSAYESRKPHDCGMTTLISLRYGLVWHNFSFSSRRQDWHSRTRPAWSTGKPCASSYGLSRSLSHLKNWRQYAALSHTNEIASKEPDWTAYTNRKLRTLSVPLSEIKGYRTLPLHVIASIPFAHPTFSPSRFIAALTMPQAPSPVKILSNNLPMYLRPREESKQSSVEDIHFTS